MSTLGLGKGVNWTLSPFEKELIGFSDTKEYANCISWNLGLTSSKSRVFLWCNQFVFNFSCSTVVDRGVYYYLSLISFPPPKIFCWILFPIAKYKCVAKFLNYFFLTSFNLFFLFFPLFFSFFLPFPPFFFPFFSSPPFLSLLFLISFEFSSLISDFWFLFPPPEGGGQK